MEKEERDTKGSTETRPEQRDDHTRGRASTAVTWTRQTDPTCASPSSGTELWTQHLWPKPLSPAVGNWPGTDDTDDTVTLPGCHAAAPSSPKALISPQAGSFSSTPPSLCPLLGVWGPPELCQQPPASSAARKGWPGTALPPPPARLGPMNTFPLQGPPSPCDLTHAVPRPVSRAFYTQGLREGPAAELQGDTEQAQSWSQLLKAVTAFASVRT
ncbi:uncharacterized protein LOC123630786 [Lemur catta]|uniref:uncharacterized protein LOC123630786 n=1 Tax=Lemur catta TaxID=9447 RepID=UPI001E26D2BD|nr:uncharacterized protein LOC123630786 [Lemur catta]XP_045396712.1 uncharacterized protein LOC123630786 [Lemur catta]XP_045396713.1 uncharacterized protein LOC123630786 [Lemur catta]XP_045396714.1 uncharacterized protein LOC123630786 [Lemur catta]